MPKFSKGLRPEAGVPEYLGVLLFMFLVFSCSRAMSRDRYFSDTRSPALAPPSQNQSVADARPPDSYPIPLSETEKLVYEFLSLQNCEIRRNGLENGDVVLSARKNGEEWKIVLRPISGSATEAFLSYANNGKGEDKELERLGNHVMTNAQKVVIEGDNAASYVPSAILSLAESVVCLESVLSDRRLQFSGFIVDEDGLVLATAHDLKGHQELNVTFFDGRQAAGRVVKADHRLDLALIKVDLKLMSRVALEKGRNLLGVGERLYTVGCPNNLRGTVFPGIVNGPPRRVDDLVYWQVNMKIHPGSSGSPVFDAGGSFVSVVKGRLRGTDSLGFLIPFETVVEFVKGIRIGGIEEK